MMPENEKQNDLKTQMWGWALFVICGVLFTISGLRAQDILTVAGSVIFLLGCIVFIMPLMKAMTQDE
jgi:choline-glycine betaine transporter